MSDIEVEFHEFKIGVFKRALIWLLELPFVRTMGWYAAEWLREREMLKATKKLMGELGLSSEEVDEALTAGEIAIERLTPEEAAAELQFLSDCEEFGEDPFDPDFMLDPDEDDDPDFTLDEDDFEDEGDEDK